MNKEDLFKDKIVVVTGAASGIGRSVAARLGRLGTTVCAADINEPGTRETVKLIGAAGGNAYAAKLDVTKSAEIKKLIDNVIKKHGRLDYMFNNAGIAIVGETRDMTDEHWKKIIDINLMGVLAGTLAAYRVMVRQGFGHIVNTASLAGLIPVPLETSYSLTKYAVVGLSTSLRGEGAALGVKVSVVCPGFIRTPILDNYIAVGFDPADLTDKPKKMTEVNDAAHIILSGVAKNKSIILVGSDARIAWFLYKIWPGLVDFIGRKAMDDLRKIRKEK
ncbi:MAG: SDR family NAD(P)-dependent oxidoreductase [Deltaproteobacteria bacterium]|nr:SDR family NAD(P)-dependent oxidoreductase [Candidatus Zymogenaceae bacterium]